MIDLIEYLNESILDVDKNIDNVKAYKQIVKDIKKFIRDNYSYKSLVIADKPSENGKFKVFCSKGDICFWTYGESKTLTNGEFYWGNAPHDFQCDECESLEDMPNYVHGSLILNNLKTPLMSFDYITNNVNSKLAISNNFVKDLKGLEHVQCRHFEVSCNQIKDLTGSPKDIKENVKVCDCENLKSLKGLPNNINGELYISNCNSLENLIGGPTNAKIIIIKNCEKLESLKGLPNAKEYYITNCPNLTDIDDAPLNIYYKDCPKAEEIKKNKIAEKTSQQPGFIINGNKVKIATLDDLAKNFGFDSIKDVPAKHELMQQYIIIDRYYHIDTVYKEKTLDQEYYYMCPNLSWDKRSAALEIAKKHKIKSKHNIRQSGRGEAEEVDIVRLVDALKVKEIHTVRALF